VDVLQTEFFAFFCLTETRRSELPDGRVSAVYRTTSPLTAYRTGSPKFHDPVSVDVVADGRGTVRLALSIGGLFIADPWDWMNAMDITKSFILDGLGTKEDRERILPIVRDIRHRPIPGTGPDMFRPLSVDKRKDTANIIKRQVDLGRPVVFMSGGGEGGDLSLPAVYSRGYSVYIGERPAFTAELSMTRFSMRNETADGKRLLTIAFDRTAPPAQQPPTAIHVRQTREVQG
jgi:hypothetical protein